MTNQGSVVVEAVVSIDRQGWSVTIASRDIAPDYIGDFARIATLAEAVARLGEADAILMEAQTVTMADAQPPSLADNLRMLLSMAMAAAVGAMSAASAHALATAYLSHSDRRDFHKATPEEDFAGKMSGIGAAYACLAAPWIIVTSACVFAIIRRGPMEIAEAVAATAAAATEPLRVVVFVGSAIAGYAIFASAVLTLTVRAKTAAAARAIGPIASMVAVAPAPIALIASNQTSDVMFNILTLTPFTAPAALQMAFDSMDREDVLIRLGVLMFVGVLAVRLAITHVKRQSAAGALSERAR